MGAFSQRLENHMNINSATLYVLTILLWLE